MLPLTKVVHQFKEYVINAAIKSSAALEGNQNSVRDFKTLVDAALVLVILYNRRRIGDVQYTTLQTHLNTYDNSNLDECLKALKPSERALTTYYKPVVTGGKGSRQVVVLFPRQLQGFMNTIIRIRQATKLVPENNPYLFAYPNSMRWVRADVAMRKFAGKSNIENPHLFTSNRLRKQIATVMQILNMNHEESEQFTQFMGHREKTHNEFYK